MAIHYLKIFPTCRFYGLADNWYYLGMYLRVPNNFSDVQLPQKKKDQKTKHCEEKKVRK